MKRLYIFILASFLIFQAGVSELYGQGRLIRRVQREVENKAIEEIFGKEEEKKAESADEGDSRSGRHRRGGGLSADIPDVVLHIAEADESFTAKNYTSAKSSLRNALWGVELEMGQNVLKSLPERVGALEYDASSDQVSSSGIGFVGLVIERYYSGPKDMSLSLSVASDAGLLGLANLAYLSEHHQSSSDQTDYKQIRFKDQRAYIQFDDSDGYTLSVPFGQSSIFMLQGVNFESEGDFMTAANQFDIQTIKQKLGEQ